jgi:hypothetical protein
MGEQVRLEPEPPPQLHRSAVRYGELVDDRQPGGVAEGGVASHSKRSRRNHIDRISVTSES